MNTTENKGSWKKGQSGNPNGRPRDRVTAVGAGVPSPSEIAKSAKLREAILEAAPIAIQTLIEVMTNLDAEVADRVRAASTIINRAVAAPREVGEQSSSDVALHRLAEALEAKQDDSGDQPMRIQ